MNRHLSFFLYQFNFQLHSHHESFTFKGIRSFHTFSLYPPQLLIRGHICAVSSLCIASWEWATFLLSLCRVLNCFMYLPQFIVGDIFTSWFAIALSLFIWNTDQCILYEFFFLLFPVLYNWQIYNLLYWVLFWIMISINFLCDDSRTFNYFFIEW